MTLYSVLKYTLKKYTKVGNELLTPHRHALCHDRLSEKNKKQKQKTKTFPGIKWSQANEKTAKPAVL